MLSSSVYSRRSNATDTTSHLRSAGVQTQYESNASQCLKWGERPQTPPELKKYRQSLIHEPGRIVKHYGVADDPVPEGTFGITTPGGETADRAIKCYPDSDISRWKLGQVESIYASSKRKPLGKSYKRGHKIPPELGTIKPFGKAINAQELEKSQQARTVIFPVDRSPEEDQNARHLYIKSHGSYEAGEQRRRDYDWQKSTIQPEEFCFGAMLSAGNEDVKTCLVHNDLDDKLVNRVYKDWKLTQADVLGKVKVLGAKLGTPPPDHTFGARSAPMQQPGARELIGGHYSMQEQQPDPDLGKSIREGWRNVAPHEKVFGVPSVRTDIPKPKVAKVTSAISYGEDSCMGQLLNPSKFDILGISSDQLSRLLSKEEIHSYLYAGGINAMEAELERSFQAAARVDSSSGDKCSLATFLHLRQTSK